MTTLVPIHLVDANSWQTRQSAPDPAYIQELAADIQANGLLQPPLGRLVQGGRVQLAFGHNRLAAYRLLAAGLDPEKWLEIPVDIRDLTDEQLADYAWSENERRRDVDPISRALAIQRRLSDFSWTHEMAAQHLQISRPAITNALRLLNLPDNVRSAVTEGRLSARQADALLSLFELPESFREQAENGYNYRPSQIVKEALAGKVSSDEIRRQVDYIISQYGAKLSGAGWKIADEFTGDGLVSPACKDCPSRLKEGNLCLDRKCFDRKSKLYQARQLESVSQVTGYPVYTGSMTHYELTTFSGYDRQAKADLATIRQAGCPNLALLPERGGKFDGHEGVELVCSKRSGYCTCRKGLEMQRELERRERQAQAVSQPVPAGKPLTEVLEDDEDDAGEPETAPAPANAPLYSAVPTTQDLEALARQARLERRDVNKYKTALIEAFGRRIAAGLAGMDPNTWRLLAGREIGYRFSRDEAKAWDLDTLLLEIGKYCAERALPWEPKSPSDILQRFNDTLAEYGLLPIPMPEIEP